jgi:glycosyltransferase involved in cell wall biosynthesis
LLVPFGRRDELAAAVAALVEDPATARAMGEAGRALVEHGYTWDERFAALKGRTEQVIGALPSPGFARRRGRPIIASRL